MGFFGKVYETIRNKVWENTALSDLHETFRSKARDDICAALKKIGVDAEIAVRGHDIEGTAGGFRYLWPLSTYSLGVIDIHTGPISWVHVRRNPGWGQSAGTEQEKQYVDYWVPDPKLGVDTPPLRIKSVRVKTLSWKGKDFGLGIIDRLESDHSLERPMMRKGCDVFIYPHRKRKCWIISSETWDPPKEELWNCYQAIAQHLLAEWKSED